MLLDFRYSPSAEKSYHLLWEGTGYTVREHHAPLQTQLAKVSGVVETTLYEAVKSLGEQSTLASAFADIFAWDVDFSRGVQRGDEFSILYEKRFLETEAGADVYIGPEPPASSAAEESSDEPPIVNEYVGQILLEDFRNNLAYRRFYGDLSDEEAAEFIHSRMRELRDRWALVGEVPYPVALPRGYTTFAYVRRDSRHFDTLAAALRPLIATPPEELNRAISLDE